MAQKINNSQQTNETVSIDANGWSVLTLPGGKRRWRKKWSYNVTLGANAQSEVILGAALPVGVSNLENYFYQMTATTNGAAYSQAQIRMNGNISSISSITVDVRNKDTTSRTWTGSISILIEE
jgi:hypothetical protein